VTLLNKSPDPLIAPSVSACGCEFNYELQFYLVAETHSFFVGNFAAPFSSLGFPLTACLIMMVALSYLPALALNPLAERLLFTR
jgi:hypothetical protein